MATSLQFTKENSSRDYTVSHLIATAEVRNRKFQVSNGLEKGLKNYDCRNALQKGLTACFSNKTRKFAILDEQGKVIAECNVRKRPNLEMMEEDRKAKADTWSFNEWLEPHFVNGKIFIALEPGGRFTFSDIYCFDESKKVVELFQRSVVKPRFYKNHMLSGRSSDPYSYSGETTYELCNLDTGRVTEINIPAGNLPSARMEAEGIRFTDHYKQGTIACYDYDGYRTE